MDGDRTIIDTRAVAARVSFIKSLMDVIGAGDPTCTVSTRQWTSLVTTACVELLIRESGPEWTITQLQLYIEDIERRSRPVN